jgi:CheY-like chemotaxis protein
MPKLDGRQVLEQIRSIHELRNIRVVVLTTSHQEEDITRSYDLGVHSYITKPVDLDQFFNVVRTLEEYWFQIVVLPPKDDK